MIVADTNLLAALVMPSPNCELAEAIYRLDQQWKAPVLIFSELRNVAMAYYRKALATQEALLTALSVAREVVPDEMLHLPSDQAVLALAAASSCSACDCEFVALAQELGVPMLTWDKQLLAAFPSTCQAPEQWLETR